MTKLLTKAEILAAGARRTKDIEIPEWGGNVRVMELSVRGMDLIQRSMSTDENIDRSALLVEMAIQAVVNEDGAPRFTDEDKPDLLELGLVPLTTIWDAVMTGFEDLEPAADDTTEDGPAED